MNNCFQFLHDIKIVPREIDCSQSPIFSWDRRDRARLTINAGHLDFQSYRVLPGEEYPIYLGGEGRFGRRREKYFSRLPTLRAITPLTVRRVRSRRSHGKIGDCEQSTREIENNGYAKFWGVNKVHCGLCENGQFQCWLAKRLSGSARFARFRVKTKRFAWVKRSPLENLSGPLSTG